MCINSAFDILDQIRSKETITDGEVDLLANLADHDDSEVRYIVAEILVNSGSERSEKILIKLLDDNDEMVRANACDSLCISKNRYVVELLKKRVKDRCSLVRSYAVLSIGDILISINDRENVDVYNFLKERLTFERIINAKISFYRTLYLLGDEDEYLNLLINELHGKKYQNRCSVINALMDILSNRNRDRIRTALVELRRYEKTIAVQSKITEALGLNSATS